MTRKKLPTINVTGCSDCPFSQWDSNYWGYECLFPCPEQPFLPRVTEHGNDHVHPDWCPGVKYDLAVEFPDA